MTQLRDQIISNLKKIRVQSLKKFLLYTMSEKLFYISSRRAKYDYKLALETLFLIDQLQTEITTNPKEASKFFETNPWLFEGKK